MPSDVRRLGEIRNLSNFRRFVRLCAGRIGQLVNLSSLGADAGVSHTTARAWLTVLEASYIIFQLPPYYSNISKRLVKSPKFYFCDVGLAAYLIGIEHAAQVATHPLRGALFENAVVAEVLKHRFNRGNQANLSFFRDSKGLECDLFYPAGSGFAAIEVKSGATIGSDYFRSLHRVAEVVPDITSRTVVYGGEARQSRSDSEVIPLAHLGGYLDMLEVNRDLAVFVEANKGQAPEDTDIRDLDIAYTKHIRPMLDGLQTTLGPLADALFRTDTQISYVMFDGTESNSSSLLAARRWERTKAECIVSDGFKLSGDRPLWLKHVYTLKDYTGRGNAGFSVALAIRWTLDGEWLSRSVDVDGVLLADLEARIAYEDLDREHTTEVQAVAEISRYIMRLIDKRR